MSDNMDNGKMQNKNALKSGIWYIISNFIVKGIAFITTPIFTRFLTKNDFGLYNNYISWLGIISIFVTLNLGSTLISAKYDFKDDFDGYIFSMLGLSSLSALFWFVIFNIFSNYFTVLFGMNQIYINAMLLYLFFLPAVDLFQGRERYSLKYKKLVATSLVIAFGTAVLSILLVFLMENKLTGRIVGLIVPTIVIGIILYLYFFSTGKRVKLKYWKYALPICLPYIPHLLSLNLLNSIDRVMITKWCSSEETAIYSLAYTCGSMVTMLMTSMNNAYAPWLGNKLNSKEIRSIRKFSTFYILGFVGLAVGIMAIAPEILLILGGSSYKESKYVIAPIAMGCVCQFIYTMFVNIEQFKRKTMGMAAASTVAAGLNCILNYIFIPRMGYLVAAYTTLAGYLCLLLMHMLLVYRLKLNNVYNYKTIIIVVTLMMFFTVTMTYMYSHLTLRFIFIGIYVIGLVYIIIKYKNKLIMVWKRRE